MFRNGSFRILSAGLVALLGACTASVSPESGSGGRGGGSGGGGASPVDQPPDTIESCRDVSWTPGEGLVRRLNPWELRAVAAEALRIEPPALDVAATLRFETEGFSNTARGLIVTDDLTNWYDAFATQVAERVSDYGALMKDVAGCAEDTLGCRSEYVRGLGRRLFRRPVVEGQMDIFVGLFETAEKAGDGVDVGARLVLEAMLQSPLFLYLAEPVNPDTSAERLDDFALAARLSFLLWGTGPDGELSGLADDGQLQAGENLRSQVQRLLDDDRAQRNEGVFLSDWLNLDHLDHVNRDARQYPEWSEDLRKAMATESERFWKALWTADRPLLDMYTLEESHASAPLARALGLPDDAEGPIDTSGIDERIGILTQAGVLAVSGERDDPSLVGRGLYVLRNLLCSESAPPPQDVNAEPIVSKSGLTQRGAADERGAIGRCGGCHRSFDPLAYALEPFDGIGRHRQTDAFGNPLRSDGELGAPVFDEPQPYRNVDEFAHLLRRSDLARACVIQKQLQYALARPLLQGDAAAADRCLIDSIGQELGDDAFSAKDLMRVIATHPVMRTPRRN